MRIHISERQAMEISAYIHEVNLHLARMRKPAIDALRYPTSVLLFGAAGLSARDAAQALAEAKERLDDAVA